MEREPNFFINEELLQVLEVRPIIDWNKGKAVEFLLESLDNMPPYLNYFMIMLANRDDVLPVYVGDGLTNKDAFKVPIAYKNKVEELRKQELEEEELNNQLEQLKESYTILSTVEERRLYDWSLARSDQPDRYMWPFEADITQIPTGIPPPREPKEVGPTMAVGYFFPEWLILGFTLAILLNR